MLNQVVKEPGCLLMDICMLYIEVMVEAISEV